MAPVMCHFIKLVLPAQTDIETLQPIAERYSRRLGPDADDRIRRRLADNERAFFTNGNCDCGTMLARRRIKTLAAHEEREEARQRIAGWSETKQRRWKDQRAEVAARKAKVRGRAKLDEVEQWCSFIADLLDAKLDQVGLVVHWVTDEVKRGPVLSRANLNSDTLAGLDESVLYTFTRRP
jgi:hypothetical protein